MNSKMQRLVCFLILYLILPTPLGGAANMDKALVGQLTATLEAFASSKGLGGTELETLLGEVVLKSQKYRQGGAGIIDKDIFAILSESKNSLVISGKKWEGKSSDINEIVITDGQRVLESIDSVDVSNIKLIIFSPKEVRYINLTNNSGGIYNR